MTVKRVWPIYRLARRSIIIGIKIKATSLNSYTNIKSSMDEIHGFFYSGKPQRHKSPTVNADLALKDPIKSSRRIVTLWRSCPEVRVIHKLKSCVLKSAFLHRLKGRVQKSMTFHKPEGRVPFIKLKKVGLHPLSDPKPRSLSKAEPRSLSKPELRPLASQSRVSLNCSEPCLSQQFRVTSLLITQSRVSTTNEGFVSFTNSVLLEFLFYHS